MKCHISRKLNAQEQRALNEEVNNQVQDWYDKHRLDIDKLAVYALCKHFKDINNKDVFDFYKGFVEVEDRLLEAYDNFIDAPFAADIYLEERGINIDAWYRQIKSS